MVEIKAVRLVEDTTHVKTLLSGTISYAAVRAGKFMMLMGDEGTEWHLLLTELETQVLIRGLLTPQQAAIAGYPPAVEDRKKRRSKKKLTHQPLDTGVQ